MLGRWVESAAKDEDPLGALLRVLFVVSLLGAALLLAVLVGAFWLLVRGAR